MVWFQCEDCGENLKKPKLSNHFRCCAARKLSCIDCGVVFDRQSVQLHTSCVTEAEKYGPKGVPDASGQKPKSGAVKSSGELDLKYGLSTRPPWSCSVCNVKASSEESLALHSQGKKHAKKVKAAVGKTVDVNASKDPVEQSTLANSPAVDATEVPEGGLSVLSGDEASKGLGFQSIEGAVEGERESGKKSKKKKKKLNSENDREDGEADKAIKVSSSKAEQQSKAEKSKTSKKENDLQLTGVDLTENCGKEETGKASKKRKEQGNGTDDQDGKDPLKDPVLGGQKKKKKKLKRENGREDGVVDKADKDGSESLGNEKAEQQSKADKVKTSKEEDGVQSKGTDLTLNGGEKGQGGKKKKRKALKVENDTEDGEADKAIKEGQGSLRDLDAEQQSKAGKVKTEKDLQSQGIDLTVNGGKKETGKTSKKRKEHSNGTGDQDSKDPLKDHQGVKKKKNKKLQE